jgi:acyl-CoA reductase-like NAD-dependent aldehyde dehydrogenase
MSALPIFLAGRWAQGRGAPIESRFPHDGSSNGHVAAASAADAEQAIERAAAAQRSTGWGSALPRDRARVLLKIADGLEAEAEDIARTQTRDTGKTLAETRALVASAAGTFRFFAAAAETHEEEITAPRGAHITMSLWEPMGVVGAITPWNSPIASDAQKIAPALAAGNAVVVKPSGWSPMVGLKLARVAEKAGLPEGLLSVLPGAGREVGDVLVRHPLVQKISFTGGTETGKGIARLAADKLMPVSLELGGKSPTIVFDDADMDQAIAGVLFGVFSSTGQSCIAGSRLFVQASVFDAFVARLVARTRALRVGHPEDAATQVAPLIRPAHRDSVAGHVAAAVAEGATVLAGGAAPEGEAYARGSYWLPTILGGVTNAARICREEVFGPVLVVLPFSDEADLLAQANDSVYGLAAGIWSADYRRIWRLARALEAGTVWINTYKQFSIGTPFGGWKASGPGLEKGRLGIRSYLRQKSLYWDLSGAPIGWAG